MEQYTEEKFLEMYNEYAPKLYSYCYFRVHSKEDAEDLASKVFMKTWDYLVQGNKVENMRAFLYRSAHNLVVDFYKTSKKDRELSIHAFDGETIDIPDSTNISADLETKHLVGSITKHLDQLNDDYKEIIILRYINDLSIKEIAQATEMTENNVSVKLHRATEKLKTLTINP